MTTNTNSAQERTASIDLEQLDDICQSWKTGVISGQSAMIDISGVVEVARRSLTSDHRETTSGAPADPMDSPLPCDIKVGAVTIRKGCKLRTLVTRMESLQRMAMKAFPDPTPEARALIDAMIRGDEIPVNLHEAPSPDAGQEEASGEQHSIADDSKFSVLADTWACKWAAGDASWMRSWDDLIAYIDGRTAGTRGIGSDGAAGTVEKDAARYRMLIEGEPIERTDEFLSSECTSWECDPTGIFVGCFYGTRLFKPARRKVAAIEAHNKAGKEQG